MSVEPQIQGDENGNAESVEQAVPVSRPGKKTWPNIIVLLVILLIIAAGAVTSAYTVPAGHTGVVLRFGKFSSTAAPGMHLRAPFGIDRVMDVNTDKVEVETFGFRSVNPGIGNKTVKDAESRRESLMLTGDLSIINVEWTVEYKRQDPVKFLFSTHDPIQLIRDTGESVIRQVVGDRSFDHVLENRGELGRVFHEELQEALDRYDCGIRVLNVRIADVTPPDAVKAASNEVNEARLEKERLINQALEAYNQEMPRARGEAQAAVDAARGYALERVNRAQGEASRFSDVLKEYRKAKEVTKKRLYLETCREVLPKARSVIVIDSRQKNILPLDLGKIGSPGGGEK